MHIPCIAMSSTFRFHSQVNEVVPANATYVFPTQSTKVNKQTVKLVPKNGSTFTAGQQVRIEFPADNYLNCLNSVLQFDLQIQRTPSIVTTIVGTNITAADVAVAGPKNSDLVVSICSTLPAGGTPVSAANSPALGTWATTINAYAGGTVTVFRDGVCFTACILASDVAAYTGSQSSATAGAGRQQILYLSTPLKCGKIAAGDVITIHAGQALQRGGAQNLIKRLRVIYGSLVLEDIPEYKTLVRILYELGVQRDYAESHGQINEGVYSTSTKDYTVSGYDHGISGSALRPFDLAGRTNLAVDFSAPAAADTQATANSLVLQSEILGYVATPATEMAKLDCVPMSYVNSSGSYVSTPTTLFNYGAKTYCLNLLSGVFTQRKLIPLKWMAAQLVVELTLATPEDAFISDTPASSATLTYSLSNVNYIAEMLEFDSTYDTGIYDSITAQGIPIKFGTFHYHTINLTGTNQTVQIHERSRSVKGAFGVIRSTQANSIMYDSDRFFDNVGEEFDTTDGFIKYPKNGCIDTYQWRVGGRYVFLHSSYNSQL